MSTQQTEDPMYTRTVKAPIFAYMIKLEHFANCAVDQAFVSTT